MSKNKATTIAFRLTEEDRVKLQAEADKNYRSLSQEVLMRVKKSLIEDESK